VTSGSERQSRTRIGVVTGSRLEARCLPADSRLIIRCSGADAGRARAHAEALARAGVDALLSFGLAGGLDPVLRPGDLLIPDVVFAPDGRRTEVHREWCAYLRRRLARASLEAQAGELCGSDRPVMTPDAKAQLFELTGALAVDMESHAVAAIASGAGLPFLVLRALADPADQALPALARHALGSDGRVRPLHVAAGLLRQPKDLPVLLKLGKDSRTGLRALTRAAKLCLD
jgi:adenosylhomocysteine nucleosidase